jgi:3-oxoacyl-[acyl-carrier protein] reductase
MNILVTGISRGLGLEITKVLLKKGHTVYGISRTSTEEFIKIKEEYADSLHWQRYDLSDVENIREEIFKKWLSDVELHGFVNNAAIAYDTLLTNMDYATLLNMTKINQLSPMLMTKYFIRNLLLHNNSGSIVHISSICVHTGYKGLSMYAATKGALEAFSKNTAREWGVKDIRSNCIAAGFMDTDMTINMAENIKEKIAKRTSLGRSTSEHSVAATTLFLLSNESSSITGQVFHVDCGTI